MKKPELLAPAGTLKSMRYAFAYGADAVYAGQPRYSLRVRNNDFQDQNLAKAVEEARALGKRFYIAANTIPHNRKVKTFLRDIEPVVAMKPDALIMADPGLIMMVRQTWPDVVIHLSVQMNTVNYASVRFWQKVGVRRIILSRELSLDEVAEIRRECPEMELEVFVHGALCVAYSGRCLLSGYFNHRDSNQGTCTNSCRWEYKIREAKETLEGDYLPGQDIDTDFASEHNEDGVKHSVQTRHPLADRAYFLEEGKRAGELMPVIEDDHGTYIMNSKDLRALEHVQRLCEIGVEGLKIEGRTKSFYYVARTSQVYRQAIDDALAGRPLDSKLMGVLENLSHRGYTDGFYRRQQADEYHNYTTGSSNSDRQRFVAEALHVDVEGGWLELDVKNRFCVGDYLELILPDGNNREIRLEQMEDMEGNAIAVAPGSGHTVRIRVAGVASDKVLVSRKL